MRDESCRKCGNEVTILETCNKCETPFIFECKNCDLQTEKQFQCNCVIA